MSPPADETRPGPATLGDLFEDEHGKQWRQIGYSALPTVMFTSEDDFVVKVTAATSSAFVYGLHLVADD